MAIVSDKESTVLPTKEDTDLAREASRAISRVQPEELRVKVDDTELVLPRAATKLIHHLLTEMSLGNAVTLIPIHAELTTQEAADFLNVSRPYLIRQLEQGRIPYHMVGTHRRIRFQDLESFRSETEKKRQETMDELAAQAQELRMGY
jgi:excisionase family DNA binding protein